MEVIRANDISNMAENHRFELVDFIFFKYEICSGVKIFVNNML